MIQVVLPRNLQGLAGTGRVVELDVSGPVTQRSVLDALEERGHRLDVVPPSTLGKVCAVGVEPADGFVRAAAGPRGRQAYAVCR